MAGKGFNKDQEVQLRAGVRTIRVRPSPATTDRWELMGDVMVSMGSFKLVFSESISSSGSCSLPFQIVEQALFFLSPGP